MEAEPLVPLDLKNRWIDPRFAAATAGVVAVILYASLFPFEFHPSIDPWEQLISNLRAGRMDVIANILFYMPLGLFGARALSRFPTIFRICIVTAFGAVLSVGIELAQCYDTGRDSGLADVFANSTGALVGALVVTLAPGRLRRRPFVLLLLTCWIGYSLFPYTLALHFPDLFANISWLKIAEQTIVSLSVALLLEDLVGAERNRVVFPCLALAVATMSFAMEGPRFEPEAFWGAALSVLIWSAFLWKAPSRAGWIALLFAAQIALDALRPFSFTSTARPFWLVPFLSFLNAGRDTVVYEAFLKTFSYGVLLWTMMRAGWTLRQAAFTSIALVLALRVAQVFLPGRSAEITDALMVLGLAGTIQLLREDPAPGRLLRLRKRHETVPYATDGE